MSGDNVIRLKPMRPCAICGKPSTQAYSPFCSAHCQDVDLNRWLSDAYRVPTKEEPEAPPDPSADDGDED